MLNGLEPTKWTDENVQDAANRHGIYIFEQIVESEERKTGMYRLREQHMEMLRRALGRLRENREAAQNVRDSETLAVNTRAAIATEAAARSADEQSAAAWAALRMSKYALAVAIFAALLTFWQFISGK